MALNKGIITAAMVASAAVTGAGAQTTQTAKQVNAVTAPLNGGSITVIQDDAMGAGGAVGIVTGDRDRALSLRIQQQTAATYINASGAMKINDNILIFAGVRTAREKASRALNNPEANGNLTGIEGEVGVTVANIAGFREASIGLTAGQTGTTHLGSKQWDHETRYAIETDTSIKNYIDTWTTREDYYAKGKQWRGATASATLDIGNQSEMIISATRSGDLLDRQLTARYYSGGSGGRWNAALTYEDTSLYGKMMSTRMGVEAQYAINDEVILATGIKKGIQDNQKATTAGLRVQLTTDAIRKTGERPTTRDAVNAKKHVEQHGNTPLTGLASRVDLVTEQSETPKTTVLLSQYEKAPVVVPPKPVAPGVDTPASVTIATPTITPTSISCSGTAYDVDAPAGFNYDVRCIVRNMSGAIVSATALTPATAYTYTLVYNEWDKVTNTIKLNSTTAAQNFTTLAAAWVPPSLSGINVSTSIVGVFGAPVDVTVTLPDLKDNSGNTISYNINLSSLPQSDINGPVVWNATQTGIQMRITVVGPYGLDLPGPYGTSQKYNLPITSPSGTGTGTLQFTITK